MWTKSRTPILPDPGNLTRGALSFYGPRESDTRPSTDLLLFHTCLFSSSFTDMSVFSGLFSSFISLCFTHDEGLVSRFGQMSLALFTLAGAACL